MKLLQTLLLLTMLTSAPLKADDFSLIDLNGKTFTLSAHKGKWVLVNFWATWCPPCLEEIPDLIALHENNKNLVVVGIAMDYENKKQISDFADDNLMSYPLVLGSESAVRQFGTPEVLPTTYLYNPQGKLVQRFRGLINRKTVEKLLKPGS